MKKLFFISLIILVLITLAPQSTWAANADAQAKWQERQEKLETKKAEIQAHKEEIGEQVQAKKEEIQAKHQQRRSEIAQRHANRLQHRFGIYYQRLNNIANKIQTRMTTMADNGHDTTAAQAKLDETRVQLEKANGLAADAVAAFGAIDATDLETQKSQTQVAKDKTKNAREAFKQVRDMLHETIKLLKPTTE